jgi:hypothetical protein
LETRLTLERAELEPLVLRALEQHADFPLATLLRAEAAAREARWQKARRLLEPMGPDALGADARAHWQHVLGLARFHAGELDEAIAAWEAVPSDRCELGVYAAFGRALLGEEPLDDTSTMSTAIQVLRLIRRADPLLERGDAANALALLDVPLIHGVREVQSSARLAAAHLACEPASPLGRFHKAVCLARLARLRMPERLIERELPLPGTSWDAARLNAVAERARGWLERFELSG